jgi:hypothetical protein
MAEQVDPMAVGWRSAFPWIALAVALATDCPAANQQYEASLIIDSRGNDLLPFGAFFVFGMPQGVQCHPGRPACKIASTPVIPTTFGKLYFDPLGTLCTPFGYFGATRASMSASFLAGPPFHRNPAFFTPSGSPNATACTATTTAYGKVATAFLTTNDPLRGKVMKGAPLTGEQIVTLIGTGPAGFKMKAAPATPVKVPGPTGFGIRRTTVGEFNSVYPYVYSYTYATLRNDAGSFFAGGGPGSFTAKYTAAEIKVMAGPAKFGGVMRLLGKLTTKGCYYKYGGCSLGIKNGRYDAIGATPYTYMGSVTKGHPAYHTAVHYNTALMTGSTLLAYGLRFPWTTGTVVVSAAYPDFAVTYEVRKGYDKRTKLGKGKIQLVTPVLTNWLHKGYAAQTGGIGVLRLDFVPEPESWLLLAVGFLTLAVLYRYSGRGTGR